VAVLFVMQGAPDLALTQFVIETVTLVAFVLALRLLPDRFPAPRARPGWRLTRTLQIAISAAVGLFVTAFAVVTASARDRAPLSQEYLERALPEAGGRNVVNDILVDFRAFDTFGEISVLTVAALGMISMVVLGRRVGGAMGGVRPRDGLAPTDAAADATSDAAADAAAEARSEDGGGLGRDRRRDAEREPHPDQGSEQGPERGPEKEPKQAPKQDRDPERGR
jgi:multisubunit Na+/H+ antiporter MnhB subunit